MAPATTSCTPTTTEIRDLALACKKLWELDDNRLTPGVHYKINLQNGKSSYQHGDFAKEKLFTFVDHKIFERPTFKLFHDLLDNYERGTGVAETVSMEEQRENTLFINALMETKPIKYVYSWLSHNKKFCGDATAFKRKLHDIWFGLYRREIQNDSSGFEHVFVGEKKDGKVVGCHNWLQLYNEERIGRLDYRGYIKPHQRGRSCMEPQENEQLITIQFSWDKEIKPVSTSLIGVSPEFEVALYTLCFLNGQEANEVTLGPYRCVIKCFAIGRGDRTKIGSVFPDAAPMSEQQAATKIQSQFRGKLTRNQFEGTLKISEVHVTPPNAWGKRPAIITNQLQQPPAKAWGNK